MIKACTGYALCQLVKGRTYRVIRKGSKRDMDFARRAAKHDFPGETYCVFLTVSKQIGDLIR